MFRLAKFPNFLNYKALLSLIHCIRFIMKKKKISVIFSIPHANLILKTFFFFFKQFK